MSTNMQSSMAPGPAAAPRNNMLPPNIFDPRTDGSDYYWYIANIPNAIAPGVTLNASIQIDAGTDFYWIATTQSSDTAAALTESTNIIPLVTVLINDTGTSRNLMNSAIPIPGLAGDGKRPYRLVRPRLFRANSIINLTFTSYAPTGTTYANIYLTLHGYRRLVTPPASSGG
jgi:hypothetical protein